MGFSRQEYWGELLFPSSNIISGKNVFAWGFWPPGSLNNVIYNEGLGCYSPYSTSLTSGSTIWGVYGFNKTLSPESQVSFLVGKTLRV